MPVAELAGPALVALTGVIVMLATASAVAKAVRDRRAAGRASATLAFRPSIAALVGGTAAPEGAPGVGGHDSRLFETAIVDMLPLLRGRERAGLVRVLEDRGVVDRARRATYSRSSLRRARAAETLGACATRRALPELGRLLRDRDREVRIVAARALGKLGGAGAVPFLLGSLEKPRPLPLSIITMALMHIGPSGIDEMREGLRAPSPRAREAAAEVLGQFGASSAVPELIESLRDPEPLVRARSASALGRIGSPRAVAPLLELLGADETLETRRAAVTALGAIGSPDAVEAVRAALDSAESDISWRAARALAQLGAPGRLVLDERAHRTDRTGGHAREALAGAGMRPARGPGRQAPVASR